MAGAALLQALRVPRVTARYATGFTTAALWSTGVTGAAFLLSEFEGGALIDRGLALLTLLGAGFMVLWGDVPVAFGP